MMTEDEECWVDAMELRIKALEKTVDINMDTGNSMVDVLNSLLTRIETLESLKVLH